MPAVSKKQRRFMAMCEHDPKHAKGECPDMAVSQMKHYAKTPEKNLPLTKGKK